MTKRARHRDAPSPLLCGRTTRIADSSLRRLHGFADRERPAWIRPRLALPPSGPGSIAPVFRRPAGKKTPELTDDGSGNFTGLGQVFSGEAGTLMDGDGTYRPPSRRRRTHQRPAWTGGGSFEFSRVGS